MADATPRTEYLTGHSITPDVVTSPGKWSVAVDATGGPFKLVVNGHNTADIDAATADAADVLAALDDAAPELDADDITVTGGPANAGGTTPFVVTIQTAGDNSDVVPTLAAGAETLTGGAGTLTVTTIDIPQVQAAHQTTVITDPDSQDAVQTPLAQQTGTVGDAGEDSPATTLGL